MAEEKKPGKVRQPMTDEQKKLSALFRDWAYSPGYRRLQMLVDAMVEYELKHHLTQINRKRSDATEAIPTASPQSD